jgi:hypothetical protein
MASVLGTDLGVQSFEDVFWFNINREHITTLEKKYGIFNFDEEGYYVASEGKLFNIFVVSTS